MIRAIEHTAIAAQDARGLARWYCETLGFHVVVDGGEKGNWFIAPAEGGSMIEFVHATAAPRVQRERNDPGWSHLAFTVTDFDTLCESLRAKGVTFTGAPAGSPGEQRMAFFLDQEGNVLQIAQRPKPLGS
jgi:catechol 2,3-dioxygenase-like lactoylglutathione lyase family enzyme